MDKRSYQEWFLRKMAGAPEYNAGSIGQRIDNVLGNTLGAAQFSGKNNRNGLAARTANVVDAAGQAIKDNTNPAFSPTGWINNANTAAKDFVGQYSAVGQNMANAGKTALNGVRAAGNAFVDSLNK